ncbi:MAG: N-acetylmuramoyl-L-alanine amidase [Pseudonocardiaceae bacterium]
MISRRQVLAVALAAGAMALSDQALAAGWRPAEPPRPDDGVPQTLAAVAGPGGGAATPGFPVGHLGLAWSGGLRGGGVRFRTRDGWSSWRPLPHGDSPGSDRRSVLVPAGGALGYELSPPPGASAVRMVAINTTDGPRVRRAAGATDGFAVPGGAAPGQFSKGTRFLSRAGWGADESLRFGADGAELFPPAYFPVQTLTVHHTVTANDDPDPAATVRAIYFFHTITQQFGDIGYHLLVDRNGTLYEGRWSGADRFPVFADPTSGGPPQMSNGAHVAGFNAGNVGVALLGDLTTNQPTPAARRALTRVLAALAGVTGLDPQGRVSYVNPIDGARAEVDVIAGHRDWLATECPGNAFYPALPEIRRDVAALLGNQPKSPGP